MMENKDVLDQIFAKLSEQDQFQEEVRKEFIEVKNEQIRMNELLLTTSETSNEPLDGIDALSKRLWNVEKNISKIERRIGME